MNRSAPSELVAQDIATDQLLLDARNPRLKDFDIGESPSQGEILRALWSKMAVDEVALSIAENGFYRHEPLYAAKEDGKIYVVEGNRRLAAVKLLRDDKLRRDSKATSLPAIDSAAKRKLDTLPVIICERAQVWAFLGFKHINGPQAWESYPKASYIAWVHNEVDVPLGKLCTGRCGGANC